jgi:outer membrane protein assembly factor BamA
MFCNKNLLAQDSLRAPKKISFKALPVIFYSPESKWGGGVAGVSSFNFKTDTLGARKSSVNIGMAYTQLNQILAYLPFQFYPRNFTYSIYGELGYYLYNYYYYGIGNFNQAGSKEMYEAEFARIRLSALKKWGKNFLAGIKYAYDKLSIRPLDVSGELIAKTIAGSDGGTVSGIGPVINYDSRDHVFYPRKGLLAEFFYYTEKKFTGSSFDYNRFTLDASYYLPSGKQNVFAFNLYAVNITGTAPFTHLAMVGGTKKMRGYYEGRFRDNNLVMIQSEYRHTFYKRLGAVIFTGVSWVSPTISSMQIKYTYLNGGAGLRFALNKNDKINLRLDFGVGKNSTGFYFTVGEAF